MLSVDYLKCMRSKQSNICDIKYSQSSVISVHRHWSIWKMQLPVTQTWSICSRNKSEGNVECRSNLQSHRENTWISWSGVWRWKMLRLREIGRRHNSYINMILRQVAFSILTAYFLGRQMSDVSMGVTGRERPTLFFFPSMLWGRERLFCRVDSDGGRGYVKWWREVFWLKGIFRGKSILERV